MKTIVIIITLAMVAGCAGMNLNDDVLAELGYMDRTGSDADLSGIKEGLLATGKSFDGFDWSNVEEYMNNHGNNGTTSKAAFDNHTRTCGKNRW